ncbi:glycosyltransferase family 2 protein [Candidatus Pacearchaeota archaeon]|nr:glycosyltransferase family 2 protein [Candidatus Pacearchaeota archaeon]
MINKMAEIKSKTLRTSPVNKNKLFINKTPPKNKLICNGRFTPKIKVNKVIEASKSKNPKILTNTIFSSHFSNLKTLSLKIFIDIFICQNMQNKLMILIVAYNAESTISSLLGRIPEEIWKKSEEIIIANDCSKDSTYRVAQEYKEKHKKKNLIIINHKINKGYGGNQKWGYAYAIKKKYDTVVMIHGDAQYPPEYISELIKPIEERKADFMFGSRMAGHPLKGGMPFYKFLGNIFLTSIENLVLGTKLTEFHSGFRAYSLRALKDIPFNLNSDGFHFDSEIIIQLIIAKKKIGEIVIPTFYGDEKCNVNVITYGLNILKILLQSILHKYNLRKYSNFNISHY